VWGALYLEAKQHRLGGAARLLLELHEAHGGMVLQHNTLKVAAEELR